MRICAALAALALLAYGATARAGVPALPSTEAGRQLAGWLEVYNQGDADAFDRFALDRFATSAPAVGNTLFREAGPLGLIQIEESRPTEITAVVQDSWGRYERVALTIEAAPPYRITGVRVLQIPRPDYVPAPRRLSQAALVTALRTGLEAAAKQDRFSGAVLVARAGRTIFSSAYGMADSEAGVKNAVDTRFRMGSMNKMMTAVAVLQLAQAGKLRLDGTVGDYLPGYPNRAMAGATLHQLLTHTAGAGDIFGPEFQARRLSLKDPRDYVDLYGGRDPEFAPGSQYRYSNYGFVLLGRIVEQVSGQAYDAYLEEHVFKPAKMTATGALPESDEAPGRATGYMRTASGFESNAATLPYRGTPAGGGYSTVGDLLLFAEALKDFQLLDAAHTALLTTGKTDAGPQLRYAYGFEEAAQGARVFGHSGGAPGMNGDLRIMPDTGYVVVVLSNRDPPAAESFASFIVQRLPVQRRGRLPGERPMTATAPEGSAPGPRQSPDPRRIAVSNTHR